MKIDQTHAEWVRRGGPLHVVAEPKFIGDSCLIGCYGMVQCCHGHRWLSGSTNACDPCMANKCDWERGQHLRGQETWMEFPTTPTLVPEDLDE